MASLQLGSSFNPSLQEAVTCAYFNGIGLSLEPDLTFPPCSRSAVGPAVASASTRTDMMAPSISATLIISAAVWTFFCELGRARIPSPWPPMNAFMAEWYFRMAAMLYRLRAQSTSRRSISVSTLPQTGGRYSQASVADHSHKNPALANEVSQTLQEDTSGGAVNSGLSGLPFSSRLRYNELSSGSWGFSRGPDLTQEFEGRKGPRI